MGCSFSSEKGDIFLRQGAASMHMVVFLPGLRLPSQTFDFHSTFAELVPKDILDQLSFLRARVMRLGVALEDKITTVSKLRSQWKSFTQHGKKKVSDLQQALEDYLLMMINLVNEDVQPAQTVPFVWKNQEDAQLETSISEFYYEVASVLHAMAMCSLFQANLLLTYNGQETSGLEDRRKQAIDVFLKVSGVLECAVKNILPRLSKEGRSKIPADLKEGVLHALLMQSLGQSVEIQLGLAIENVKATLAVKRRLACEQVKCFLEAFGDIQALGVGGIWGEKHLLFISWKLAEAKAAAFYFHGLMLAEGTEEDAHGNAIVSLETANGYLKESQNLSVKFSSTFPRTRPAPVWGTMKYLTEKIPWDLTNKKRMYRSSKHKEKFPGQVAQLPDFALSLHPEEFKLPGILSKSDA